MGRWFVSWQQCRLLTSSLYDNSLILFLYFSQTKYKDAFKEYRREKLLSPGDAEFLAILEESLDESRRQKDAAQQNLQELERSILATTTKISEVEKKLEDKKAEIYIVDSESSSDEKDSTSKISNAPRRMTRKKRKKTQEEVKQEIEEVFTENEATEDDVNLSMMNTID